MDNQADKSDQTTRTKGAKFSKNTLFLTRFSILLAIEAIFCFTPLGSIPIGPIVATLAIVPVVLTGVLMGPRAGMLMGFFAGLFSFIVWTFMPPSPIAFIFTPFYSVGGVSGNLWSLAICFVPRVLVGFVAGGLFYILSRAFPAGAGNAAAYLISGLLGSLTNTFLVLGGIYVFFGRQYTEVLKVAYSALLGLIGLTLATNGVMEASIAALAAFFIGRAIGSAARFFKKR